MPVVVAGVLAFFAIRRLNRAGLRSPWVWGAAIFLLALGLRFFAFANIAYVPTSDFQNYYNMGVAFTRGDYAAIARVWRGGCIIRSAFLDHIAGAYQAEPELANMLFAPYFTDKLSKAEAELRQTVVLAAQHGIPTPCLSAALNYFDSLRSAWLPANLLQAQRDYFGAHTYERVDRPRGEFFHTNWTGTGGDTTSSSYNS